MTEIPEKPPKQSLGACPRCGARLQMNPAEGRIWCPSCGYRINVQR